MNNSNSTVDNSRLETLIIWLSAKPFLVKIGENLIKITYAHTHIFSQFTPLLSKSNYYNYSLPFKGGMIEQVFQIC